MNLPFIEHRVVSIELTQNKLKWVEISKIGSIIKLIGSGEDVWQPDIHENIDALEQLKDQIQADVYKVSVTCSESVLGVYSEEAPYFEEEEALEDWLLEKEKKLINDYSIPSLTKRQLIEIDEDLNKVIFVTVKADLIQEIETVFIESGLPISTFYTGVVELGYSQIFEPDLIEGLRGVLNIQPNQSYLSVFKDGLIYDLFSFTDHQEEDVDYVVQQSDSFLHSIEVQSQANEFSSSLFMNRKVSYSEQKRSCSEIQPLTSNKSFEELLPAHAIVVGSALKSFYPDLDSFEFTSTNSKELAIEKVDKASFLKAGVLLLVPIFLILILTYAGNAILDYRLIESNQVMSSIEDKLELVNTEGERVQTLFKSYKEVNDVLEKRQNTAKAFSVLNKTVHNDLIFNNIKIEPFESGKAKVTLQGVAKKETSISDFMRRLSSHEWVEAPQLLNSETKGDDNYKYEFKVAVMVEIQ
ncbi:MAG: PilN domain-containing protein [Balneolaceae bacterium]